MMIVLGQDLLHPGDLRVVHANRAYAVGTTRTLDVLVPRRELLNECAQEDVVARAPNYVVAAHLGGELQLTGAYRELQPAGASTSDCCRRCVCCNCRAAEIHVKGVDGCQVAEHDGSMEPVTMMSDRSDEELPMSDGEYRRAVTALAELLQFVMTESPTS